MPPWTFGCKRFHAAVQHLGKAGQVRNIADVEPCFAQCFRSAAGRDQLNAMRRKRLGERHQAGFISDAQQGAAKPAFCLLQLCL